MYRYDEFDQAFVESRVEQFRDQTKRRLTGELTEEQYRPLRLMNGLYLQLHAYMLRVAVPYGVLNPDQMRKLAHIARRYDRGYGHFTTRQNIQYNWPDLEDVPDILSELASVGMHAIQTSGNCIRNVTADQFAAAADDEIEDPRVWCEVIRQWSSLHPEFAFLPRKFKIAVTGSPHDRAATWFHDIGLVMRKNDAGEIGFEVLVGGGQGRTPMIAKTVRDFLPKQYLLSYLEAILRVYNMEGRRDNKFKARIKILVHETGIDKIRELVEAEWEQIKTTDLDLPAGELARIQAYFEPPVFEDLNDFEGLAAERLQDLRFDQWVGTNIRRHQKPGYAIASISLKPEGGIPGDATAEQMDVVADLAERYSIGEVRVTHEQNLVLPHVKQSDLKAVYSILQKNGMGTPNLSLVSDIICCPGLDYCNLANARSIPLAQQISIHFGDLKRQLDIGELKLKISGCINACGHHHVGHIGILGVDRKGEEYYQITLGGSADESASIGKIVGPAFCKDTVIAAINTVVQTYLDLRDGSERFLDTYRRIGIKPFKERLYAAD